MKPFIPFLPVVAENMSAEQLATLNELDRRLQKIPNDLELPPAVECLSCHMFATALFRFKYPLKLTLQHGWFSGVNHSWLTDDTGAVYDPYLPGVFPARGHCVQFFAPRIAAPGRLYETVAECKRRFRGERRRGNCPDTYDPNRVRCPFEKTPVFKESVEILVGVMR